MSRTTPPDTVPSPPGGAAAALVRRCLLLTALAGACALLAAGLAARVGGPGAWQAALVGCAAAWLAALAGSLPPALASGREPADRANALLAGMLVRFLLSLALGTAALIVGDFSRGPLLLALAAAYVLLLAAETWIDLNSGAGGAGPVSGGSSR
jgi:hypothetical protein